MTPEEKLAFFDYIPGFDPSNAKDIGVNTFEWRCCAEKDENGRWIYHKAQLNEFWISDGAPLGKIGQCPKCGRWYFFFYDDVKK